MSKPTPSERGDVYARVTDRIVAAIEAGAGDFNMPWHHDGSGSVRPVNAATCRAYRGVNVVALWSAAQALAYPSGLFATYRQWAALGAQVRKGERGHLVVFWKTQDRNGDDGGAEAEPEGRPGRRMFARGFTVFNAAQVDGYAPAASGPRLPESERIAHAETFYAALGVETRHGGNRAFYVPSRDYIQLPPFGAFKDAVGYYSTALHEAGHSTMAPHRVGRDLAGRFGSESYAAEELVAELCAAFVCADLSLAVEPRPDHAAYIASWLKVLRADPRAIFTAASKAQAAADWMHARQPGVQATAQAA